MAQWRQTKPPILVAEDEGLLRLYAAGVLEERGYEVIEAKDADEALRILEDRSDVRLLFTDIQMPGPIDGMELARQVHARWPHVLLIITSGSARPRDSEIPDDGRFLSKPYAEEELAKEVDRLMRES